MVSVNTVVPGSIETVRGFAAGGNHGRATLPDSPLGRRGRPEEIAAILPDSRLEEIPADVSPSHNYMVLFVDGSGGVTRDALHLRLKESGIQTKRYFYPAGVEYGTSKQAANPFMRRAFESKGPVARQITIEAIKQGVEEEVAKG